MCSLKLWKNAKRTTFTVASIIMPSIGRCLFYDWITFMQFSHIHWSISTFVPKLLLSMSHFIHTIHTSFGQFGQLMKISIVVGVCDFLILIHASKNEWLSLPKTERTKNKNNNKNVFKIIGIHDLHSTHKTFSLFISSWAWNFKFYCFSVVQNPLIQS